MLTGVKFLSSTAALRSAESESGHSAALDPVIRRRSRHRADADDAAARTSERRGDRGIPAGKQLEAKSGLTMSTIRREQAAGRFPKFRQLSAGRVGVLESEIDAWLASRPLAKDAGFGTQHAGPGRGHRGRRAAKAVAAEPKEAPPG
jgi:predicted DNA-binding transcriptional regulator AlpA